MSGLFSILNVGQALFAVVLLGTFLFKRRQTGTPPPGPKGWPVIGNALNMPAAHQWLTFAKWGEVWGDIISVELFGQTMVILNSADDAINLLDKKSSIYSDRPTLTMGGTMVGWDKTLILQRYGSTFREIRRYFHQVIGTRKHVEKFMPAAEATTMRLQLNLLRHPESFLDHIRSSIGTTILMITYGYSVQEGDDPLVKIVNIATDEFSLSTAPGVWLVDIFLMLRFVPSWLPGAGWKKTAAAWARDFREMCDAPLRFTKQQMHEGTATHSFTSALLEGNVGKEKEDVIKIAATSLYSGGADTTVSAISTFFLAMTLFPEVQKKAQSEIDTVIGSDRLPTSSDREKLPYVHALCLEVLRWNPVAPLGPPHRLMQDDVYEGYTLPKDTVVIANIWKFLHDPRTYINPMEFSPERFMSSGDKKAERDPRELCFGFGRRICPGLNLADASLFATVAMTLATFDIAKPVENGQTIEPHFQYATGTISHPEPFKCSIKPRSAKAEALIRAANEPASE